VALEYGSMDAHFRLARRQENNRHYQGAAFTALAASTLLLSLFVELPDTKLLVFAIAAAFFFVVLIRTFIVDSRRTTSHLESGSTVDNMSPLRITSAPHESSIVIWDTFWGLAVANGVRLVGFRFEPRSIVVMSILIAVANLIAIAARLLRSRAAFYSGVCGSLLTGICVPNYQANPEHLVPYLEQLEHEAMWLTGALGVGATFGVGTGWWCQIQQRRRGCKTNLHAPAP